MYNSVMFNALWRLLLSAVIFIVILNSYCESKKYPFNSFDKLHVKRSSRNCICVPYWQCKEDFSGLIEDGEDIIDIRTLTNSFENLDLSCTGDFDVCCEIECGKLKNGFTLSHLKLKILNSGQYNTEFAEFPWMLGLLQNHVFQCGASLIHPQVAITAAHCISNTGSYNVRAGEWNWTSGEEPLPYQERLTQKIIIHPNYNPETLQNDIAILILTHAFKLAENVGIVCLPRQGLLFDNVRCITTGWGKNSFYKGSYQAVLKKVDLPIISREHCLRSLRNVHFGQHFELHNSFICAGGENKKDACKGDGGGPLMCSVLDSPDRFQQVGIVSWGLSCGVKNTPGVYVNVAQFREWIDQQLSTHDFDILLYRF